MSPTLARCFRRAYSLPSHFSNPALAPAPYGSAQKPVASVDSSEVSSKSDDATSSIPPPKSDRTEGLLKELSSVLAMCALAYIAIDNYNNRIRLEKLNHDTTAINLKTLQLQQANFMNAKKKLDLAVVEERKENSKRNFKMSLHVALLRKQLKEAGIEPLGIEEATREYEQNVRADSSVRHVSGQALWLDDSSSEYILSVTDAKLTQVSNHTFQMLMNTTKGRGVVK